MRSLKSSEETKKELRRRDIGEENIKMAFELAKQIRILDRRIFPENHKPFCFALKGSHSGQCASYGPDTADDKDRFYSIVLENLLENLTEIKNNSALVVAMNGEAGEQADFSKYTWEELFKALAAHEVRHRLQFNCSIKKFSPEVISSLDDQFLRDVIKLVELEFNRKRQILNKRGETKEYIEHALDSLEFDAEVIEKIVAFKVCKKAPLAEIISVIQMQAPEKA